MSLPHADRQHSPAVSTADTGVTSVSTDGADTTSTVRSTPAPSTTEPRPTVPVPQTAMPTTTLAPTIAAADLRPRLLDVFIGISGDATAAGCLTDAVFAGVADGSITSVDVDTDVRNVITAPMKTLLDTIEADRRCA